MAEPASPEIRMALARWRWGIVLATLIGALAGLLIGLRVPPMYQATSSLAVAPGTDLAQPFAVVKRLEYQTEARLVETLADLASDPTVWIDATDALDFSGTGGYSSEIEFSGGSHIVTIAVEGPSAELAARLADEVGRTTTTRFSAAYPLYRVRVVDQGTSVALSLGRPLYVLPIVIALVAALAASATVIALHNRGGRLRRATIADGSTLAEEAGHLDEASSHPPVFNQGPLFRNVAIAGIVGLTAGIVAAGTGAALFTVVALAGALAIAAAALRPEWALVGLIALVTLRIAEIGNDFYGIPQITIPAIAVILLVVLFRRWVWGEQPTGWAMALGGVSLVTIAALVSVFNAAYPEQSLGPLVELAKSAIVLLLVVVLIKSVRDFRLAIWTLIVLGGLVASLSVFQYVTGSFDQTFFGLAQATYMNIAFDLNDYRISGPIGDPNFYGQMLVPVFAIALERAWHESVPHLRLVAAGTAVVTPLAIIFTFSRGALLALGVVGVAMLFALRPSWRAIAGAAAVLAIVIVLLPPSYVTRTTALFGSDQSAETSTDPSVSSRKSNVLAGLQMFYDYPVAGVGIGNFRDRYLEYAEGIGLDDFRMTTEPHSFYVEIAAETGIIGLAAWGVIGFAVIEILMAARRRLAASGKGDLHEMVTAYAIGLLGFYTAALFLHLAYARYMWILLGIVFAIPKVVASVVESDRPAARVS